MKYVKETSWEVIEEVTVRTLMERYKASGNDRHCMDGLAFICDDEQYDFEPQWHWLSKLDQNRKFMIVDKSETVTVTYLT